MLIFLDINHNLTYKTYNAMVYIVDDSKTGNYSFFIDYDNQTDKTEYCNTDRMYI